jgi:hypothetical protein
MLVVGTEVGTTGVPKTGASVGARPPAGAREESKNGLSDDPTGALEDSIGSFVGSIMVGEFVTGAFSEGFTVEVGEGGCVSGSLAGCEGGGISVGEPKRACIG